MILYLKQVVHLDPFVAEGPVEQKTQPTNISFSLPSISFFKHLKKLKAAISAVSLLQILSQRLNLFKYVTYPLWPEVDTSSELSFHFSPELQLSSLSPSSELSFPPLLELELVAALSSPTRQTRKDVIGPAPRQFW